MPRAWAVLGGVAFFGVHALVAHHIARRFAMPTAVIIGGALAAIASHTGLFARLHGRIRRP
jgi:hypothetical protein